MVTVEQVENPDGALIAAIFAENGRWIARGYRIEDAELIAWALNNVWKHGDGTTRCSGCGGEAGDCDEYGS